jgi:hypothetical protein
MVPALRGVYKVVIVLLCRFLLGFLLLSLFESLRGFNVIYKWDYCFGV